MITPKEERYPPEAALPTPTNQNIKDENILEGVSNCENISGDTSSDSEVRIRFVC